MELSSETYKYIPANSFAFHRPLEAPVYEPSLKQFEDPLAYIQKIKIKAEQFGICRIKPPRGWKPPFNVDTKKFKFNARIQQMNTLEAGTRIKLYFLARLRKFWSLQGLKLNIPSVECSVIDLYCLYHFVRLKGGMDQCNAQNNWTKIADLMFLSPKYAEFLYLLYRTVLYPYQLFQNRLGSEETEEIVPGINIRKTKRQREKKSSIENNVKLEMECDDSDVDEFIGFPSPSELQDETLEDNFSDLHVSQPRLPKRGRPRKEKKSPNNFVVKSEQCSEETNAEAMHRTSNYENESEDAEKAGSSKEWLGLSRVLEPQEVTLEETLGGLDISPLPKKPGRKKKKVPTEVFVKLEQLQTCKVCGNYVGIDPALPTMKCRDCSAAYHNACLSAKLPSDRKLWRCFDCVEKKLNSDFEPLGFKEKEEEMSLEEFQKTAEDFKHKYFEDGPAPFDVVEKAFWRLLSDFDNDDTVLYGADLHTSKHGSGFPTEYDATKDVELRKYAVSDWNLNNFANMRNNVLHYVKGEISGMKSPWVYVGMCFSAFCWHVEDHWTYSVNYLHWGEAKTWYGVPGKYAPEFERVCKKAAPELFKNSPDLLNQITTLINPNVFMSEGVPMYRTDQVAGEFVITFPRAYHAGFNQGCNFAEAVNFATADWMPFGSRSVDYYADIRRQNVFCFQELLVNLADGLEAGQDLLALHAFNEFLIIFKVEVQVRKYIKEKWGCTNREYCEFESLSDNERQCHVCNTSVYLSAVTCPCDQSRDKLACLKHFYMFSCRCEPSNHILKYRWSIDQLTVHLAILRKLIDPSTTFDELNTLSELLSRTQS